MSPARSWRSPSHAAGSHDLLPPKKNGGPGLRRGGIGRYNLQSLLTVAHQPRACCIRLVQKYEFSGLFTRCLETIDVCIWRMFVLCML